MKNQEFFRLPGGGIEFGETAEQTLQREFAEEFGVEIKVGRRLGVAENIFVTEGKTVTKSFCFLKPFLPTKNCIPRQACLLLSRVWKTPPPDGWR